MSKYIDHCFIIALQPTASWSNRKILRDSSSIYFVYLLNPSQGGLSQLSLGEKYTLDRSPATQRQTRETTIHAHTHF